MASIVLILFAYLNRKTSNNISHYRSPSQTADKFDKRLTNFNLCLESITQTDSFLSVAIDDFNARLSKW